MHEDVVWRVVMISMPRTFGLIWPVEVALWHVVTPFLGWVKLEEPAGVPLIAPMDTLELNHSRITDPGADRGQRPTLWQRYGGSLVSGICGVERTAGLRAFHART